MEESVIREGGRGGKGGEGVVMIGFKGMEGEGKGREEGGRGEGRHWS